MSETKGQGLEDLGKGGVQPALDARVPMPLPPDSGGEPPPQDPFAERWKFLSEWEGGDPLTHPPPEREWLLKRSQCVTINRVQKTIEVGVLPRGKVGMLASAGGGSKTMGLTQLAIAVATGQKWLGTFSVSHPGNVLLVLAEEDDEEVRRRIHFAAKVMGLSPAAQQDARDRILPIALAGVPVALLEPEYRGGVAVKESWNLKHLRKHLEDSGVDWSLIVLDPLSRWAGGDTEKDNAVATRFIQVVETLATVRGHPTVLLAHHTTKSARNEDGNEATSARGASGLTDAVRWQANLEIPRAESTSPKGNSKKRGKLLHDYVELRVTKSNYSLLGESVTLIRVDGGALRPLTDYESRVFDEARSGVATASGRDAYHGTSNGTSSLKPDRDAEIDSDIDELFPNPNDQPS